MWYSNNIGWDLVEVTSEKKVNPIRITRNKLEDILFIITFVIQK